MRAAVVWQWRRRRRGAPSLHRGKDFVGDKDSLFKSNRVLGKPRLGTKNRIDRPLSSDGFLEQVSSFHEKPTLCFAFVAALEPSGCLNDWIARTGDLSWHR